MNAVNKYSSPSSPACSLEPRKRAGNSAMTRIDMAILPFLPRVVLRNGLERVEVVELHLAPRDGGRYTPPTSRLAEHDAVQLPL
ncbi:hypothetical protein DL765_004267 [Monosporascus sp. GIB2]|nr:hypothetical protein DL765_004267 [Monosporascus sp. GIB2]